MREVNTNEGIMFNSNSHLIERTIPTFENNTCLQTAGHMIYLCDFSFLNICSEISMTTFDFVKPNIQFSPALLAASLDVI